MGGEMRVADILAQYRPGDSGDQGDPDTWTWSDEFAQLWGMESDGYMANLVNDIRKRGIKEPVLLGHDGRLWDGHHRLAVAVALMRDTVPFVHAERLAGGHCCDSCWEDEHGRS